MAGYGALLTAQNPQGITTVANPNAVTGTLSAAWNGTSPATAPAGSVVSTNMAGASTATVYVAGTFSLTNVVEAYFDAAGTWVAVEEQYIASTAPVEFTGSLAANGLVQIYAPGAAQVRVRCSAYTSGTATVTITPTPFAPFLPSSQSTSISASSGTFNALLNNASLASGTPSGVSSTGYPKTCVLVFSGTAAATGTFSVLQAADSSSSAAFVTTATQAIAAAGAFSFAVTLPNLRFTKVSANTNLTVAYCYISVSY